jgi:hypothetical protein
VYDPHLGRVIRDIHLILVFHSKGKRPRFTSKTNVYLTFYYGHSFPISMVSCIKIWQWGQFQITENYLSFYFIVFLFIYLCTNLFKTCHSKTNERSQTYQHVMTWATLLMMIKGHCATLICIAHLYTKEVPTCVYLRDRWEANLRCHRLSETYTSKQDSTVSSDVSVLQVLWLLKWSTLQLQTFVGPNVV